MHCTALPKWNLRWRLPRLHVDVIQTRLSSNHGWFSTRVDYDLALFTLNCLFHFRYHHLITSTAFIAHCCTSDFKSWLKPEVMTPCNIKNMMLKKINGNNLIFTKRGPDSTGLSPLFGLELSTLPFSTHMIMTFALSMTFRKRLVKVSQTCLISAS